MICLRVRYNDVYFAYKIKYKIENEIIDERCSLKIYVHKGKVIKIEEVKRVWNTEQNTYTCNNCEDFKYQHSLDEITDAMNAHGYELKFEYMEQESDGHYGDNKYEK